MELLVFASGVIAGLAAGIALGAWRAFALVRHRTAVRNAAAGIARVGLDALPTRSAADILSGRIRIVLGGLPYVIPVLPRGASREWIEKLDGRFASIASALDAAGDDTPAILTLLTAHTDDMVGMLREYDVNGILPDDVFINDWATDGEILAAMVEVWRAANPLAAMAAEAGASTTDETPAEPPSSPLTHTGGVLETSPSA